jgi:biotin-dependent carboxylase-like uncharacterized protein
MTAAVRVLSPGLMTTVQDLGRTGYQHLGVAVSGALDPVSLRAVNALVGNPPGAAALEAAYVGPTLLVQTESVRFAVVGANATVEVLPGKDAPSGRRYPSLRTIVAKRNEVIRIGAFADSAVLYIAVEGGLAIDPVLGSASTYIRGGFGGWQGRALAVGDCIPVRQSAAAAGGERQLNGLDLRPPERYRAMLGPQDELFSAPAVAALFASEYVIEPDSNRMGLRLAGPRLGHVRGFDIVSDGIAPGSIQVPGNGQPIVLMADRQTTGGYPKIATVVSADLPALGRARIGTRIRFERITIEEAHALRRRHVADIDRIAGLVVPLVPTEQDIAAVLFENNLISGAIYARS